MISQTTTPWYAAQWWTAIMGAGQLLAAFAAAWAAIVARRAAKAAEDSVKVTKDTALAADLSSRHRDRAYVALADTLGPDQYAVGTIFEMTMHFKNVGVTPAYNVRFGALITITDAIPTEDFLDENTALADMGPLAPTIPIPVHCRGNQEGAFALSQQGLEGLRSGDGVAVASAKVIYSDAFGDMHETKVAYLFDPNVMGFRFAPFYNSMT